MSALRELLDRATQVEASDIHLAPDRPPAFRVRGELVESGFPPMPSGELATIVADLIPPHQRDAYEREHEVDFSLIEPGVGRFRVNVFHGGGLPHMALRHVKEIIPTIEELHLPPILKKLALATRGIVLVCGASGCGKSTTLAAMIEHINRSEHMRILTVEDPVEYLFVDRLSLISQREVGLDTLSFHHALTHLMRQDPDVIMIGEMRDAESFRAALRAAETGHLVFSTLHCSTAAQAPQRILDMFPSSEREPLRLALADTLYAAFCQRLIPATAGGVLPAVEILINTPIVRNLLIKGSLEKLPAAIETGGEDGMQTFNQAIYNLVRRGDITEAEALRHADNPEALRMNLRGIFLDEARRILSE